MSKWVNDHLIEILMFLVGGAISAVVWVTSTFATIPYVDKGYDKIEHALIRQDDKLDKIMERLGN